MSDPIIYVGKVNAGEVPRDAFHQAYFQAVCSEDYMRGGQHVKLVYGTKNQIKDASYDEADYLGSIDCHIHPHKRLRKGDRVLVFLKPGTAVGLRHEYTHPMLDDVKPPSNGSEEWLRRFADKWNFNYDTMIAEAQIVSAKDSDGYGYGGIITAMGVDLHSRSELEGDEELFWHHIEQLTGFKADDKHKEEFCWSCSC